MDGQFFMLARIQESRAIEVTVDLAEARDSGKFRRGQEGETLSDLHKIAARVRTLC